MSDLGLKKDKKHSAPNVVNKHSMNIPFIAGSWLRFHSALFFHDRAKHVTGKFTKCLAGMGAILSRQMGNSYKCYKDNVKSPFGGPNISEGLTFQIVNGFLKFGD